MGRCCNVYADCSEYMLSAPVKFSAIAMTVCTGMAMYRGIGAWRRYVNLTRMDNYGKEFSDRSRVDKQDRSGDQKKCCVAWQRF